MSKSISLHAVRFVRNAVEGLVGASFVAAMVVGLLCSDRADAAPVSHWAFDDGSPSQTAADQFGTNHLTLGGTLAVQATDPTWTGASFLGPNALGFDGGDWAEVADNGSFALTNLSISAWVKRGNISGTRQMMAGKGNGGSGATQSFWLDFESDDRLGFYVGTGGDNYLTTSASFKVTDTTSWHHLIGTYDGATQRIYLDGAQVASASFAGSISNNASPFLAGKGYTAGAGEPFTGTLDDVSFWNNGLSVGQASALYQLAIAPGLLYNASQSNQLFAIYGAAAGTAIVGGRKWSYATGLAGGLGVPVFGSEGDIFLRLDGSGNGVQFLLQVPEPSTSVMVIFGVCGIAAFGRRRFPNVSMATSVA